jgi:hypothetical protein
MCLSFRSCGIGVQLLLTYWLPNAYWNWQEYVVSVMLISVHNIKVTCEWHKAIKQTSKTSRIRVIVVHWLPTTIDCKHLTSSQGRCELQLAITQDCNTSIRGGVHPVVCMMNKISRTQLYYIKINLTTPAWVKVEVTLNFLATGNTYRTLQHLFRIGSCRLQLLFHLHCCWL